MHHALVKSAFDQCQHTFPLLGQIAGDPLAYHRKGQPEEYCVFEFKIAEKDSEIAGKSTRADHLW